MSARPLIAAVLAVCACPRAQPAGGNPARATAVDPDPDAAVAADRNQRACAALASPAAGRDPFETFGYAFDVGAGGVLVIGHGMKDGGAALHGLAAGWGLRGVAVELCGGGRFGFMMPAVRTSDTAPVEKGIVAAGLVIDEMVVFSVVQAMDWVRQRARDPARARLILRTRQRELICWQVARELLRDDDVPSERLAPCLRQPYARFDCIMSPEEPAVRACVEGMRSLFSAPSP